jgi:hypothetical protein
MSRERSQSQKKKPVTEKEASHKRPQLFGSIYLKHPEQVGLQKSKSRLAVIRG